MPARRLISPFSRSIKFVKCILAHRRPRHSGLRIDGMVAPMVLDGPINADWFQAYVRRVLAPTLRPDDIVIMDNLSSHKRP